MDAANLLKPALARGELRCIGATTLAEYRKHMEKDAAFERRFQQVLVNEPSVSDTINILRGLSERYSSYHGVRIADRALVVAAELSDRYITARFLPDKAIDLVDEACAALRVQLDSVPEDIDALQRRITALQVRPWSHTLPSNPKTVRRVLQGAPPDPHVSSSALHRMTMADFPGPSMPANFASPLQHILARVLRRWRRQR